MGVLPFINRMSSSSKRSTLFYYFGYGSNLDMTSLRAKGVTPVSSERGVIHGWKLTFNVAHFFRHEGGVGNIQPSDNSKDRVQGILHQCLDEELPVLDKLEALGDVYDRIEIEVETENQRKINAYSYVGLPSRLDDRCLPTERYLNILIRGASQAKLDESYIQKLRQHPTYQKRHYPPFQLPQRPSDTFNAKTLAKHSFYTALAGAVFDMADARPEHDFLKGFQGGQDMTLFHLKRMDSSAGNETQEDIKNNNLTEYQRQYLNEYLHEFNVEYRFVGRFLYE